MATWEVYVQKPQAQDDTATGINVGSGFATAVDVGIRIDDSFYNQDPNFLGPGGPGNVYASSAQLYVQRVLARLMFFYEKHGWFLVAKNGGTTLNPDPNY